MENKEFRIGDEVEILKGKGGEVVKAVIWNFRLYDKGVVLEIAVPGGAISVSKEQFEILKRR